MDRVTPRHADVVFALEGVPGVQAVFAIAPPPHPVSGGLRPIELVVELLPWSWRTAMKVNARLLTVLSYDECGAVEVKTADALSAPQYMSRATRLVLSPAEREAARERAAARPSAEDDLSTVASRPARPRHALQPLVPGRRARVLVFDQHPEELEPVLAELDADVAFLHDWRRPHAERLTFVEAAREILATDVDLVLLDVQASRTRGRALFEAITAVFGPGARYHFFLTTLGQPPGWARDLVVRLPRLTKPIDPRLLAIVFDNATRWLRDAAQTV